ncbi:MAG: hypothetical protein UD936_09075 [Acutalibacteraceae bacterium]|nr:hypothetical protein [Acutalibacteraceae bacterium]
MKSLKKLTTMLLTAMLVVSTGVTGVSAADESTAEFDTAFTKNKVEDFAVAKSEALAPGVKTESKEITVHKGDKVNYWVEVSIPAGSPDVSGWTVDMYYDDAIFDVNKSFADNYGFASGTNAIDYALGNSAQAVEMPGGNLAQSGFASGVASFVDANYYGFKFAGKTSKLVCIQLDAVADATTTLAYKMRDIVDSNTSDTYYLDKTNYKPLNGASFALKADVVCDHVKVFGDINLDLTETDTGIYTGEVELPAGTYSFNINDKGTDRGMNYTYKDTATINYSAGYKAPSKLVATGGRYSFTYNTATKTLRIKFKNFADIVELVGDINVELVRTSANSTVFTGSARVDAGTYNFKINDQGTEMGFKYSFNDVVYDVQFGAGWSATTFNATGGIYSVKYDTATNKLTFRHAPKGLGDVRVFGDINLPLAGQGNGVYSAAKTLDIGTYQFRVDSLGTTLCNGSEFANSMNGVEYKTDWKAATTFSVTEKQKFTFIFDTKTNKIKVLGSPIDTTKVLVSFEDSTLELKSTDGVNYKATTTLKAGTYAFRMDEFGVTLGYGGTYTDTINGANYNASYSSATTFIANGGNYTFSYNVNTDTLKVTKVG